MIREGADYGVTETPPRKIGKTKFSKFDKDTQDKIHFEFEDELSTPKKKLIGPFPVRKSDGKILFRNKWVDKITWGGKEVRILMLVPVPNGGTRRNPTEPRDPAHTSAKQGK